MDNRNYEQLNNQLDKRAFLETYLPGGKYIGQDYHALNPKRVDNNLGSFRINFTSGLWSDYACDASGRDFIDLFAYIKDLSNSQAYDELSGASLISTTPPKATPRKEVQFIIPAPVDAESPPLHAHREDLYKYENTEGQVLFYIERYRIPGNKKSYRPFTYGTKGADKPKWHTTKPAGLFILWQLRELLTTDKEVLLVEGEKTAIAAQELFPKMFVTTWCGGCTGASKCDLSYLKDKKVWLWPDADEPGYKAMKAIKQVLPSAVIIDVLSLHKPAGWDLADAKESEDFTSLFAAPPTLSFS